MSKIIVGYCRADPLCEKDTLEFQEQCIRKYAGSRGFLVKQIYKDELSFGNDLTKQPSLRRLLDDLEVGDRIIVTRLARLTRSSETLAIIIRELIRKDSQIDELSLVYDLRVPIYTKLLVDNVNRDSFDLNLAISFGMIKA